mgnify:CR=1 FL=1
MKLVMDIIITSSQRTLADQIQAPAVVAINTSSAMDCFCAPVWRHERFFGRFTSDRAYPLAKSFVPLRCERNIPPCGNPTKLIEGALMSLGLSENLALTREDRRRDMLLTALAITSMILAYKTPTPEKRWATTTLCYTSFRGYRLSLETGVPSKDICPSTLKS